MRVEQFVMAYGVEQDRLRAMMPEGYESLRPVLRINAEIRGIGSKGAEGRCRETETLGKGSTRGKTEALGESETLYVELNTPVAAFGKRGWLNIGSFESTTEELSYERVGTAVTFFCPHLKITYTGVGIEGGCPAEKDNDGCFFPEGQVKFVPSERIDSNKEYCDCEFSWDFPEGKAHGIRIGGKTLPAVPTAPQKQYEKRPFTVQEAAAIPCEQILGAYRVIFERAV